jgi:intracellular multiplication protein IcmC
MSTASTWITNLGGSLDSIERLVTGAAYLMGLIYAFKAVYSMKAYGESRTMMSSNTSMKEPLINVIAAAGLLYLPSAVDVFMMTTFGSTNILSYDQLDTDVAQYFTVANGGQALIEFLQIIGIIAFIRGWVLLARSASHAGQQPGLIGKGIIHIFGGVLLINIVETVNIFYTTLFAA